jgi:hypothetical protein
LKNQWRSKRIRSTSGAKEIQMQKKMLIALMVSLPSIFINCSKHNDQQLPSVDDLLPDSASYLNRAYYSRNYKDSLYLHTFLYNGILFYIEGDKDKRIFNIFTGDTNFITPEGIRVGDNGSKIKEFCALRSGSSRLTEYELPSKWKALLASSDTFKGLSRSSW